MTILSRYRVGDTVWIIHSNKVQKVVLRQIFISLMDGTNPTMDNKCKHIEEYLQWETDIFDMDSTNDRRICKLESQMFTSKEELIKSL